jgi:hypothetical protein
VRAAAARAGSAAAPSSMATASARAGSETDVKEPMAERGERQGRGTAVAELEPELGGAKVGAARAVE